MVLARDEAAALDLSEDGATESAGLLASMSCSTKSPPALPGPSPKPARTQARQGQQLTTPRFPALRGVFEFGQTVTTSIEGLRSEFRAEADAGLALSGRQTGGHAGPPRLISSAAHRRRQHRHRHRKVVF
jgi:hypothetical protein